MKGRVRWVAGGLDGAISHHIMLGDASPGKPQALLELFQTYCSGPTSHNKKAIYDYLVENPAIDFVDQFMDALPKDKSLNYDRLYECAKSFAIEATDREPVKIGIAILGRFRPTADRELLLTIGRHEEFTQYSAVALGNSSDNPEPDMWTLAKNVQGWGRICTVERLAKTHDPAIKRWLLREGYRNSVMYEYLAYTCAVAGDLKTELEHDEIDNGLLDAAGDVIGALISGGPAESMDDYADGAAVVERYLVWMQTRATSLSHFLAVAGIKVYVTDKNANWAARTQRGWTADWRAKCAELCSAVLSNPRWREQIVGGLESTDDGAFYDADRAAGFLGVDTWPTNWRRLQQAPGKSHNWYGVMKLCNQDRIPAVIALAERTIPLEQIATGPAKEVGLGKEFQAHSCLDYVLQDLGRFPGYGYELIEVGLKSPVVRNRNMALKALSEWGQSKWPKQARQDLEHAKSIEPDDRRVRKSIQNVLDGKPFN